ncbi:MAG: hypothetical protein H7174_04340 [Flavobacterium sp.]|nr:hypothetical protein [Flavobacterium sp.]
MKKLKITLAATLLTVFAFNYSNAQEVKPVGADRKTEMMQQMKMDKEKLSLTKEQESQFKAISMKYGEKMKALKNAEGDRKEKFKQLKELRDAKNNEVKALLNPDQFKTYLSIQEERKAARKDNRQEK